MLLDRIPRDGTSVDKFTIFNLMRPCRSAQSCVLPLFIKNNFKRNVVHIFTNLPSRHKFGHPNTIRFFYTKRLRHQQVDVMLFYSVIDIWEHQWKRVIPTNSEVIILSSRADATTMAGHVCWIWRLRRRHWSWMLHQEWFFCGQHLITSTQHFEDFSNLSLQFRHLLDNLQWLLLLHTFICISIADRSKFYQTIIAKPNDVSAKSMYCICCETYAVCVKSFTASSLTDSEYIVFCVDGMRALFARHVLI